MSAFKDGIPDDAALAATLGPSLAAWSELRARVAERFAPVTEQWASSGKKYGWSLRLARKKRAIVYLSPEEGWFLASMAVGEKAVEAARGAGLPPALLAAIEAAPRFPEGRAVRLEVRAPGDVDAVLRVAELKMAT